MITLLFYNREQGTVLVGCALR